jgi:hypothetical protein
LSGDLPVNQAVNLNTGFSSVAKAVTPAVVTIETARRVRPSHFRFRFSVILFGIFSTGVFQIGSSHADALPDSRRRKGVGVWS